MKVNEIFYSLQGEGARAGQPSIFIRLAGCDLACGFCDTEFVSGKEMTCKDILAHIQHLTPSCKWIVWTGGEPTLQLCEADVIGFHSEGYKQAIETNGNHPAPPGLDWVCCSPKVAEHVVAKNFPNGVDELRYVRHAGQMGVPVPAVQAKYHFLSPRFDGERINQQNLEHCIRLCLENPQWALSVQTHKLTKVL